MCNRNVFGMGDVGLEKCHKGSNSRMWYFNVNLFSLCQDTIHMPSNTPCPVLWFILYFLLVPTLFYSAISSLPHKEGQRARELPIWLCSPLLMAMPEEGELVNSLSVKSLLSRLFPRMWELGWESSGWVPALHRSSWGLQITKSHCICPESQISPLA